jgi:hypothetical protein
MISADRTAWICDMAETYGIYDMRSLPLKTVAALSAGLRDDSRIKMKIRGEKASRTELLLATIADGVNALLWRFGAYKDKPVSIVEALLDKPKKQSGGVVAFASPEDFEAAMARFKE